ncbi:MAG: hypothetical protein LBV69_06670 [Bacteroidales bacterium]|jgi:hypothetical protein|nr:hypothetical protein [Bacteroidales bacterium]
MKNLIFSLIIVLFIIGFSCGTSTVNNMQTQDNITKTVQKFISENTINEINLTLKKLYPKDTTNRITKGIQQAATLWEANDGDEQEFKDFCLNNYVSDSDSLFLAYKKIEENLEILFGYFNIMQIKLMEPVHLDKGNIHYVNEILGAYSPSSHIISDMFDNKLAFYVILNFPAYSLSEKKENMDIWTRKEWAYARLGDLFISRAPSNLIAKVAKAEAEADTYISNYNIYLKNLVDDNMNAIFANDDKKDIILNSHWGLRDEIKANYSNPDSFEKQRMIYEVMQKIISQEIPQEVINSKEYFWNPKTNQLYKNNVEIKDFKKEPLTRYEYWMWNFKAQLSIDKYNPIYPTFIERAYDESMELTQKEIESLFVDFMTSTEVKDLGNLIKKRLGRNLEPFDIWYDGFKDRSNIDDATLTAITQKKYPNPNAFKQDIPRILKEMGWGTEKAKYIADKISVDPARGSGHAWGSEMKGDMAHLRTRIAKSGMDYKGYNIAVHELGHNVEQTITLYDIDYYFLKGVPSTSFTEAVAFMFQTNDLKLLGQKSNTNKTEEEALKTLDLCWNAYEIMGVALVDMYSWQWLYNNPDANLLEFKTAVENIAKDVWNKYYASVIGVENSTILAIYSHLICTPMYLANYPVGHLIEHQVEQNLKNKNFADEITRMLLSGKVIPQKWMKDAVNSEISGKALLKDVNYSLKIIKN